MNDELDLVISRTINAPLSAVWNAWRDPEQLKEWWCPKPWTAEVLEFDFRSGGVFDLVMRGPNGELEAEPGLFLEVVPHERIVFTSALTEGWRPANAPSLAMTAVITMVEEGEEATRYTAQVLHPDKATRDRHEEMGFFEGWGICIGQLEQVAQQLSEEAVLAYP